MLGFSERLWEADCAPYRRVFLIHLWKKILPDGAALSKALQDKKALLALTALSGAVHTGNLPRRADALVSQGYARCFSFGTTPMGNIMIYMQKSPMFRVLLRNAITIRLGNLLRRYRGGAANGESDVLTPETAHDRRSKSVCLMRKKNFSRRAPQRYIVRIACLDIRNNDTRDRVIDCLGAEKRSRRALTTNSMQRKSISSSWNCLMPETI
jgi:hypothetical protein